MRPEKDNSAEDNSASNDSSEKLADELLRSRTIEGKLEAAGAADLIRPADLKEIKDVAIRFQAELAEEIKADPVDTQTRYVRRAYVNILEDKPLTEGIISAAGHEAIKNDRPYNKIAAFIMAEHDRPRQDNRSPSETLGRELRKATAPNVDLARAQLESVKVSELSAKAKLLDALEQGSDATAEVMVAREYQDTATALEAYIAGDRSLIIRAASGKELTAEETMRSLLEGERLRGAAERKARKELELETSPDRRPDSGEETRVDVEAVPRDEKGYKEYEKKYFSSFDVNDLKLDELREFIKETINVAMEQHAKANIPNSRYPDTFAGIMSLSSGGAAEYMATYINLRGGIDGKQLGFVKDLESYRFSETVKQFLELDLEKSHPRYKEVFN